MIIAIAEKFGQLPGTVEREMTYEWYCLTVLQMDAEALDTQRRRLEDEATARR